MLEAAKTGPVTLCMYVWPGVQYIQSSPYFDPTHTRTGWIGQPPILDRLEVVTDNGDVDTLGQATPGSHMVLHRANTVHPDAM